MKSLLISLSESLMALSRVFGVSLYSKLNSKYSPTSTSTMTIENRPTYDKDYESEESNFSRSVSPAYDVRFIFSYPYYT